ncbi:MAG: hypothetical protein JXQ80_12185 [Bacteroidales bacterium]|nr:hypothetical protein [Bacteroidales bacterium]
MSVDNGKMTVDIKDFNELIALITAQNKKQDESFASFMQQLETMNKEHEKRYNEFYHISQSIFKQLKKAISDHEARLKVIEDKLEQFETIVHGR